MESVINIGGSSVHYSIESVADGCSVDTVAEVLRDGHASAALLVTKIECADGVSETEVMREFIPKFSDYIILFMAGGVGCTGVQLLRGIILARNLEFASLESMYPEDDFILYLVETQKGKEVLARVCAKNVAVQLVVDLEDDDLTKIISEELSENNLNRKNVDALIKVLQGEKLQKIQF